MEIKQLRSFVTVAECKSFSQAAQILYISQPSISTHVSMLEKEVGVKLIERTSKSLSLTEAGRELYDHAVDILKINDKMINDIGTMPSRCIHIGASTVPSAYILPDIISSYVTSGYTGTFSITQSDSRKVLNGVIEGVYDVGFVGTECHERGLQSIAIAVDEMIMIMPDTSHYRELMGKPGNRGNHGDHGNREFETDRIAEMIKSEPIIVREDGSGSGEMFKKILGEYGCSERNLNIVARVNDHEAVINMVERGAGIACISSLAVSDIKKRKILSVSPFGSLSQRTFYAIYKPSGLKKDVIREFIETIKAI